jgi:hypothetical protein
VAKYRACKMVDGNGKVWWQVAKLVWWLFWEWDRGWELNKFDNEADAIARVEELERADKAKVVRLAEVVKPVAVVEEPMELYALLEPKAPPKKKTRKTR